MANETKSTTSTTSTTTTDSSEDSDDTVDEKAPEPAKLKKKRNPISVCLTNCRYDVIKRIASKFAYKEVNEHDNWNLYWTDFSITIDKCKEMKRFQKINHFPGMLEICRKDLLARNLNRMFRLFPQDYNFFPRTWCLPADLGSVLNYCRLHRNKTFILKPDAGSQGKGICLTKCLKEIRPTDRGVCQVYITKPFLIDGFKFDLRIYALITSCDPLRIYIYNEGLVRFATMKYKEPNLVNVNNIFMHLTNYSVNKYCRNYNQDVEEGSKRRLTWFNHYIEQLGHDIRYIWKRIDDIIIKTIISASPVLKHSYIACFPNHDVIPACCELLGVDILLDQHLNPFILEMNHSPSFHTDTPLDKEIKESLLSDMFAMLNLESCNKRKILREDRKRVRERLINGKDQQLPNNNQRNFDNYYRLELLKCGKFRLVYPNNQDYYNRFFDQGQSSLYCDTIASKAREAAQNALREEMQLRAKIEAAKKLPTTSASSITSTAATAAATTSATSATSTTSTTTTTTAAGTTVRRKRSIQLNLYEPQLIVESEERERLKRLVERENLIKSHRILECIYFAMKKNGNLRPRDERKFGFLEKLESVVNDNNHGDHGNKNNVVITDFVDSITKRN